MIYPCGIIKDLLPLYIEDVCNEESKAAVEEHLTKCEECRKCYEMMKASDGFIKNDKDNSEDMKMIDSLKKIKRKLNKKTKITIASALAAVAVLFLALQMLFNAPIIKIDESDVSVSANVYKISELKSDKGDNGKVKISFGEDDNSEVINVEIPEIGSISLTREVINKNGCVSVISWTSKYFLREILSETKTDKDGGRTVYVSDFKTTVLDNKAEEYNCSVCSIEFGEINKIVYVSEDGAEKVLWENKAEE